MTGATGISRVVTYRMLPNIIQSGKRYPLLLTGLWLTLTQDSDHTSILLLTLILKEEISEMEPPSLPGLVTVVQTRLSILSSDE